jgi:NADPH-ferrihemoprotein reductase
MTGVETLASASTSYPYILGAVVVSCLGVALLIYKQQASKQLNSQPAIKRPAAETAQRLSLEDPNKPRVRLLYATQTGTAERFSKQLATELRKRYAESGTLIDVVDLENYKPAEQLPREKLLVLCVATYGDGEPTDNSAEFFSWLGKAVDNPDNSSLLKVGGAGMTGIPMS